MAFSITRNSAQALRKPSQISQPLLYGLALALVVFIVGAGGVCLYDAFNHVVSQHRGHMNTAAYDAQHYFDRREAMLRGISASLFEQPVDAKTPGSAAGAASGNGLDVIALSSVGKTQWALAMTARAERELQSMGARILHTSLRTGQTHYLRDAGPAPAASVQDWIADFLRTQAASGDAGSPAPLLWLRPPGDVLPRLFLYMRLEAPGLDGEWIGLETASEAMSALLSKDDDMRNYLLLNPRQHIVVKNGGFLADPIDFSEQAARIPERGFHIAWDGYRPTYLVLSRYIGDGGWRLVYYTRFHDMLRHGELPVYRTLFSVLCLSLLVLFVVWQIRSRLIVPAMAQYETLQENERLTATIIHAAPVGLCLLDRADASPLFRNQAARHWLAQEDMQWCRQVLCQAERAQAVERTLADGRSIHLQFLPLSHHGVAAVLCAFSDVTDQKQAQRVLLEAKRQADAASQAKSEFLATMSHEIRTPLFGVMGTLDLLALTALTERQHQYLDTVQQSAATLLRTLNETLDQSRAESSHVQLQVAPLSVLQLVNGVVANYADRARNKDILLYGVVDSRVPELVEGDELRIRQVLNNLVSNAIKFTIGGHIALRLEAQDAGPGRVSLVFRVSDTGVGIAPDVQQALFSPYYQPDAASPLSSEQSGSGLGLFICKRLAERMQGTLSITSAPGLGTCVTFTLTLPLQHAAQAPLLPRARVYVDGAVQEVVQNLCDWLNQWGLSAAAYQPGDEADAQEATLLQAWPATASSPDWPGRRIILRPPGLLPTAPSSSGCQYISCYDMTALQHLFAQTPDAVARDCRLPLPLPHDDLAGLRVMVVDDSTVNRRILQDQLQHFGCAVVSAADGTDALERLQRFPADVVLTDINMPCMDGYTLARTLRSQGHAGAVYGITASMATAPLQARALAAGMNGLLSKPLRMVALGDLLRQVTRH